MNPLLIRRRGMMAKEAVLPDGQLEWIETDGIAYLDVNVNVKFVSSSKIKMMFSAQQSRQVFCGNLVNNNAYLAPVGIWWSNGTPNITTLRYWFLNGTQYTGGFTEPIEFEHFWAGNNDTTFVVKRNGVVLNTFSYTGSISSLSNNYNMHIFGIRNYTNGHNIENVNGMRAYIVQLYDDATQTNMVFNGIAYRKNGVVGMLDTLTDTFYGNAAGSGAFTGGPNVI